MVSYSIPSIHLLLSSNLYLLHLNTAYTYLSLDFLIMSSSYKEISREVANIKEIDEGVKNIFLWEWLQEKDWNDSFLSDYICKVDLPGKVVCTICKALISYQRKWW